MKIIYLSIIVLLLAVFNILTVNKTKTPEIREAEIFLEGDMASLTRAADLKVEYDSDNVTLISSSSGGFLIASSVVNKEGWDIARSLLVSSAVDTTKPILKIKFKIKNGAMDPKIKLSPESKLYLSGFGDATLLEFGSKYRVNYN